MAGGAWVRQSTSVLPFRYWGRRGRGSNVQTKPNSLARHCAVIQACVFCSCTTAYSANNGSMNNQVPSTVPMQHKSEITYQTAPFISDLF
ncbi:hypothetical protein I7I48_03357 [Histoplasma ohiense]|nr:hypothetical protein I7I48_03357 [Histoplasma ohiense (nom. inval.)]